LDILDTAWSPALTIDRVLLSILSVLTDSHVFRERLRRRVD
jgi:ubiquitin-protein ligase